MFSTRFRRVAVAGVVAGSVLTLTGVSTASATPAVEALALANAKAIWKTQKPGTQKTTCFAYKLAPKQIINQAAAAAAKTPNSGFDLTKPAWKRVITDYLAWACSGPGTTPR